MKEQLSLFDFEVGQDAYTYGLQPSMERSWDQAVPNDSWNVSRTPEAIGDDASSGNWLRVGQGEQLEMQGRTARLIWNINRYSVACFRLGREAR
jgi:hypothetical protein